MLTLEKKLNVMNALEGGNSQRVVGERFEVAKSTIVDIWKDHKKIIDATATSESSSVMHYSPA